LNFEKKLAIPPHGNGKVEKNRFSNLKKNCPYHQREKEICHKNLK
jgi:hypothetical protein